MNILAIFWVNTHDINGYISLIMNVLAIFWVNTHDIRSFQIVFVEIKSNSSPENFLQWRETWEFFEWINLHELKKLIA